MRDAARRRVRLSRADAFRKAMEYGGKREAEGGKAGKREAVGGGREAGKAGKRESGKAIQSLFRSAVLALRPRGMGDCAEF
jgi:hypothetical protein